MRKGSKWALLPKEGPVHGQHYQLCALNLFCSIALCFCHCAGVASGPSCQERPCSQATSSPLAGLWGVSGVGCACWSRRGRSATHGRRGLVCPRHHSRPTLLCHAKCAAWRCLLPTVRALCNAFTPGASAVLLPASLSKLLFPTGRADCAAPCQPTHAARSATPPRFPTMWPACCPPSQAPALRRPRWCQPTACSWMARASRRRLCSPVRAQLSAARAVQHLNSGDGSGAGGLPPWRAGQYAFPYPNTMRP